MHRYFIANKLILKKIRLKELYSTLEELMREFSGFWHCFIFGATTIKVDPVVFIMKMFRSYWWGYTKYQMIHLEVLWNNSFWEEAADSASDHFICYLAAPRTTSGKFTYLMFITAYLQFLNQRPQDTCTKESP